MRSVSATALATLSQPYGVEPVNIIRVFWTPTQVYDYADKTLSDSIKGAILEMSAFDDVVSFDGSKSSQTFNVILNDIDGTIKAIYDTTDIHKVKVQVFQWFTGIPLSDMFLIFEGQINSPIVWKEGERSLAFAIVSQIEDQEVGFSAEEGLFDVIPDDIAGKAFPLVFGTALLVPMHRLDPIPVGILLDALLAVDPSIGNQMAVLAQRILILKLWATLCFYSAIEAYYTGTADDDFTPTDDYWIGIGDGFVEQGNGYLQEIWKLQQEIQNLASARNKQIQFTKSGVRVHQGHCFKQGEPQTATLQNGVQLQGMMVQSDFIINDTIHPATDTGTFSQLVEVPVQVSKQIGGTTTVVQKDGFVWEPADQPFKLTSALPVRYLACMLHCSVLNVWAHRNFNDTTFLMQVPTEYYAVSFDYFGSMPITTITLDKPLAYYDSRWNDNMFADLQSPVGPNTVDVLIWLIENYTVKGIDGASFDHVSALVASTPSNFAMLKQQDIIKTLGDIAYQARCALLLKNDVFYLIFLPEQPTPVETITLDDIIVNTLQLEHSPTENLITKLVADYVLTYQGGPGRKIIIRNNTGKYGIHEQTVSWYIYTNPGSVSLGASYWAIMKSNTWKLIKFKTPLSKIRLESFDAVTINFASNWVCNGPVTGIVKGVKLNTKELNLEFEVWLPIRLGEMTQYPFAWPPDSDVEVDPANIDFQKLGYDANGPLGPENGATICGASGKVIKGNRKKATHPTTADPTDTTVPTSPVVGAIDKTKKPQIPYDYNNSEPQPFDQNPQTQGAFPGKIANISEAPKYGVEVYMKGLSADTSFTTAFDPTNGTKLAIGDWVTVLIVVWYAKNTDGRDQVYSEKYVVPSSSKSAFIGQIQSGSGSTYQVQLYPDGVGSPPGETVPCTQLQIASGDSIPANSWVIVIRNTVKHSDGSTATEYTMQVPIYMQ